MSVIYYVHYFTWLRVKGTDFTIVPTRQYTFSVIIECYAVTLQIGNLYSQQFLSVFGVPNSDFSHWTSGKHIRIANREGYIIDFVIMTSVSEFRSEVFSVYPVDIGQTGSTEEITGISSESHTSDLAHNFRFTFYFHVLNGEFVQRSVSSSHN